MLARCASSAHRRLGRRALCILLLCLVGADRTRAEDSTPFATWTHPIAGRIHQAWAMRVSRCETPASDLLVLVTRGHSPEAEKRAIWMPCGAALVPDDPRIVSRRLPDETAVVDVAHVPGRDGPQLVLAHQGGLRLESLSVDGPPPRELAVEGGLALPFRPWELSRLNLVEDWHDHGPAAALAPAAGGAALIDLETGKARRLPLPVFAEYRTWMPHLPETERRWLVEETRWPTIARADENGDGRLDLIAVSRWAVWIYHSGQHGLPPEPTRRIPLVPFDAETEREYRRTATLAEVRDVDGDTRADLLYSTVSGGLTSGRTESRLFLNPGEGIDPDRPPDASRLREDGFSSFDFVDVDGDGRDEILETTIEFGVLQLVRFLLTRSAQATVRLLALDPTVPDGWRVLFEDEIAFRIDFEAGAVSGLVPTLGDWNGDGRLDFYMPDGDDAIAFRLSEPTRREEKRLRFSSAQQPVDVPLAGGKSRIVDLDGDGLDEIVAYNPDQTDAPLVVFENLGRLPGTRPTLSSGE